jgi:hypothetical protein
MARMNEGFSRHLHRASEMPNWSPLPIPTHDQPPPPVAGKSESHWAPQGPGWFDSSWLLRQGLEVTALGAGVL